MRWKQYVIAGALLGTVALLVVAVASTKLVATQDVKLEKSRVTPEIKDFPEKARPVSLKFHVGFVKSILSRKDTFGFLVDNGFLVDMVDNIDTQSVLGFYVLNDAENKTMIETVFFATKEMLPVRIHYDEETYIAEAVQTLGW